MTRLSRRAGGLGESVTLAINAKAKSLMARGEKVFRFGVGEPDFDTPAHIKEAAQRALAEGRVGTYTPVPGTPELREAVAEKFRRDGIETQAKDVVVSCGAKQALFDAVAVLADDGDEVIIPAPYWVSYPAMAEAAGATPVYLDTRVHGCILTPESLAAALTPKSKVLMLNSPGNPSGVTHTRQQLAALAPVLKDRPDITIVSDEIYQHLVYGETKFVSFAAACPELAAQTVTVNGVSKSYAMTGWRIGFATGPREIVAAMIRYQSHTTSNPTSIAQAAALAALTGPTEPIEEMRRAFDRRRLLMVDKLSAIPGATLVPPTGAFYCFPDVTEWLGGNAGKTPLELTERLLDEQRVACVPGEAFGAPTNIRLSYACSDTDIEEGCERIRRFVTR